MCIAVFIWQDHPLYPFLLLQNRDEFHNRPTNPVGWWWEGDDDILGGRDLLAGGTWLASSRHGRIAFITNVLELHTLPNAKSRGDLPLRFLKSTKSPKEFAEEVGKEADQFNGFNLMLVDIEARSMVYVSNRPSADDETIMIQEVPPGIHVLSNAKLDSPWHKASRLGVNFKSSIEKYGEGDIPIKEMAKKLMIDSTRADKNNLPHICPPDWEMSLSSIFVKVDTPMGCYGTRSIAALSVKETGEVCFYEMYLEDQTWKDHTVNYYIHKLNMPQDE